MALPFACHVKQMVAQMMYANMKVGNKEKNVYKFVVGTLMTIPSIELVMLIK